MRKKGKNKQEDEQLNNLLCSITVINSKAQLSYRRLFSLNDVHGHPESLTPSAGTNLPQGPSFWHCQAQQGPYP